VAAARKDLAGQIEASRKDLLERTERQLAALRGDLKPVFEHAASLTKHVDDAAPLFLDCEFNQDCAFNRYVGASKGVERAAMNFGQMSADVRAALPAAITTWQGIGTNVGGITANINQLTKPRWYRRQGALLIQDNASYHKDRQVWAWFASNRRWLQVHQLPPYSPEFNPTERRWLPKSRVRPVCCIDCHPRTTRGHQTGHTPPLPECPRLFGRSGPIEASVTGAPKTRLPLCSARTGVPGPQTRDRLVPGIAFGHRTARGAEGGHAEFAPTQR
jgi:hypothetical protein